MDAGRLKTLRLARGMSMDDLVVKMNGFISKQALSKYERGLMNPTPSRLVELARALGVKSSELWAAPAVKVEFIQFRKRVAMGKKEQTHLLSRLQFELEQRARLQEMVAPGQRAQLPGPFPVQSMEEAEKAAQQVREEWRLGEVPIRNLVEVLECRFIHVLEAEAPASFDGVSARIKSESEREIRAAAVVSRKGVCGERQRMNLAHELGHVVLAPVGDVKEEKAAFRFAAAFLIPAADLVCMTGRQRSVVSLDELKMLRSHFGVSMQALVHRMKELGIINDAYALEWWKTFAKNGWRKQEPDESIPEPSRWLQRSVLHAMSEGLLSFEDAAEFLGSEEGLVMPESVARRRAFMALPPEERSRILEEQANEEAKYMREHPDEEEDWSDADNYTGN